MCSLKLPDLLFTLVRILGFKRTCMLPVECSVESSILFDEANTILVTVPDYMIASWLFS